MTVVDIHTHMITEAWVERLRQHGAPQYTVGRRPDGIEALVENGSMTMAMIPRMFDLDLRIADMDKAGIDVAVLSLTSPNVYWGGAEVSAETARVINDGMRDAQAARPGRIRYLASLPWQYPELAVAELARVCEGGERGAEAAVGVMVLANINGMALTDPHFEPIWREIGRRGLAVFVHPTNPPGSADMELGPLRLLPTVGFTYDTTLAVARMVMDGFFDRFPNLKIVAAHGGGTLPYLSARMDLFFHDTPAETRRISEPPSVYLRRLYYDAALYDTGSLSLCMDLGGPERVMFGTDYPHPTDISGILNRVRDLPGDQSKAVLGGNATRLFGL